MITKGAIFNGNKMFFNLKIFNELVKQRLKELCYFNNKMYKPYVILQGDRFTKTVLLNTLKAMGRFISKKSSRGSTRIQSIY